MYGARGPLFSRRSHRSPWRVQYGKAAKIELENVWRSMTTDYINGNPQAHRAALLILLSDYPPTDLSLVTLFVLSPALLKILPVNPSLTRLPRRTESKQGNKKTSGFTSLD